MRAGVFLLVLLLSFFGQTQEAEADIFRIISGNQEAGQIRADLIGTAQNEILVSYFIFNNDATALGGLALLREAARRGVKVRILVDAPFHKISKALHAHLAEDGIEVRVFHSIRGWDWRHPYRSLKRLFYRMHDKILLADGQRFLTGGRNVEDSYFGLENDKNYIDRDVYVEGPITREVETHFNGIWESNHVTNLGTSGVSLEEKEKAGRDLDAALAVLRTGSQVDLENPVDWAEGQPDVGTVHLIHDIIRPDQEDFTHAGDQLLELAARSSRIIDIESPYLIPSKRFFRFVRKAQEKGVKIRVLTASIDSNDGILAAAGYLYYRKRLLRAGVEIWEYQGPDALHAKSAVLDERVAICGTFNLDPRSAYKNTELAAYCDSPEAAEALSADIERHRENAIRIGMDGRPMDLDHEGPYPTDRKKLWKVRCALVLVPFLRRQL